MKILYVLSFHTCWLHASRKALKRKKLPATPLLLEQLGKEVMDIHDEGMAKIMAIRRLKEKGNLL